MVLDFNTCPLLSAVVARNFMELSTVASLIQLHGFAHWRLTHVVALIIIELLNYRSVALDQSSQLAAFLLLELIDLRLCLLEYPVALVALLLKSSFQLATFGNSSLLRYLLAYYYSMILHLKFFSGFLAQVEASLHLSMCVVTLLLSFDGSDRFVKVGH